MATIIWKDGVRELVEAKNLDSHLANGWSLTKEPVKVSIEEIDTNDSGKLSPDEVRNAAKTAGIEGWENKRIKTLLKELGHGDTED